MTSLWILGRKGIDFLFENFLFYLFVLLAVLLFLLLFVTALCTALCSTSYPDLYPAFYHHTLYPSLYQFLYPIVIYTYYRALCLTIYTTLFCILSDFLRLFLTIFDTFWLFLTLSNSLSIFPFFPHPNPFLKVPPMPLLLFGGETFIEIDIYLNHFNENLLLITRTIFFACSHVDANLCNPI